ncbi:unnamed protein product [Amaranthus hypochondriacus]
MRSWKRRICVYFPEWLYHEEIFSGQFVYENDEFSQ